MAGLNSDNNVLAASSGQAWRRLGALVLVIAALGLPVNQIWTYALLIASAVIIFCGQVTPRGRAWTIAVAAVVAAGTIATLIAPAPIAEGENIFLAGKPGDVLARDLPGDVYQFMAAKFDAVYPPAVQCKDTPGCWKGMGGPDRLYAFSADGVFNNAGASRAVTGIDFSEPVWLRLGFTNDRRYNWDTDAPDAHRGDRDRRFWAGLWRWHTAMPYFVMYKFPADYIGARLCWRGDVLWQRADGHYQALSHQSMDCRDMTAADVGRPIYGVGIDTRALAMKLVGPAGVSARLVLGSVLGIAAILAVLILLARVVLRRPWTVEAVRADGEVQRWQVVGWRASGRRCAAVARQIETGSMLPPPTSLPPTPPPEPKSFWRT